MGSLDGVRIGIVTQNPINTMGGVERFSHTLAEELAKRGADITVCDGTDVTGFREMWFDRFGLGMPRRMWQLGHVAAQTFTAARVDVVIQNGISAWSLRHTAPHLPRIVVHHGTWKGVAPHGLPPRPRLRTIIAYRVIIGWFYGLIEKWTSAGAVSVGVSSSTTEELRTLYGLQATVIQNGVDLEHFAPGERMEARKSLGLSANPEEVWIAYSGRLESRKGMGVLLALTQRAHESMPALRFLFCTEREPSGWPPNVTFLVDVPYEQMPLAYRASNVFLFPSRYEGCSFSIIEAMACGLPPLLSRVGHAKDIWLADSALREYVLEGLGIDAWWHQLVRLVQDEEERRRIGTAARVYAKQHNSLEGMASHYEALIRELIGG